MSAAAIDRTLAALADPARRRTIELLRARPRRAGELAEAQGLTAATMSKHLRILRTHGLVEEARVDRADARTRVYKLVREPFRDLRTWVGEVEAFWSEQLDAFKAHAERVYAERTAAKKGRR